MTLAVPPAAVLPLRVPHQPASLNDLSSSVPTSVTPPTLTAVPAFSCPQAANPVAALALGDAAADADAEAGALDGWLAAGAWDAGVLVHAANSMIAMVMRASGPRFV